MLRRLTLSLRVRVVNVIDLLILKREDEYPHALSHQDFDALFTPDYSIYFNYHGYGDEIKGLLFGRPNLSRISVAVYSEEGSTTTPLDIMLRNDVSRYHVVKVVIRGAAERNEKVRLNMHETLSGIRHELAKVQEYIMRNGKDPDDAYDTPSFDGTGPTHREVGYAD